MPRRVVHWNWQSISGLVEKVLGYVISHAVKLVIKYGEDGILWQYPVRLLKTTFFVQKTWKFGRRACAAGYRNHQNS